MQVVTGGRVEVSGLKSWKSRSSCHTAPGDLPRLHFDAVDTRLGSLVAANLP